jgi:hypothetical protein
MPHPLVFLKISDFIIIKDIHSSVTFSLLQKSLTCVGHDLKAVKALNTVLTDIYRVSTKEL